MRIWSIHPGYLDAKGLVAAWREGLLAQKVLSGETRGYRNHSQLARFRAEPEPLRSIGSYLSELYGEASRRGYEFDGAIMLTASHLPWNRNGMKFFTRDGGLEKSDIAAILASAQADAFIPAEARGKFSKVDFLSVYAQGLVDRIRSGVRLS